MNGQNVQLKISSSLMNVGQVVKFVEEVCDVYHIDDIFFGNILVTMEEAVTNAIIHGNRMDKKKMVTISFQRIPFGISFSVEDEGEGFDVQQVPSPLESNDAIEKLAGKGLFLIHSLADKVSYNEKGNKVEISFSTSGINQETTLTRINQLQSYFSKQKTLV
jgi:serine/threonine-protein kinase RsbW